jgi:hypothetical protein
LSLLFPLESKEAERGEGKIKINKFIIWLKKALNRKVNKNKINKK